MGWEVHLTRADDWTDSEANPITAPEWLAVVAADPQLRLDTQNGPYFAVWAGPCNHPDGAWFDWADGCVSTKNPDRAILAKMLQLADKLGGRVQGDDGEEYIRPEDLFEPTETPRRPWWRFW
jgi:hypothetical protein